MSGGRRTAVAVVSVTALLAGCGGDDSMEAARELRRQTVGEKLSVKGPEGPVVGNVVELELSGAGLEVVEPEGDTSGRTGHYAVFLDRDPVLLDQKIPEDPDVLQVSEGTVELTGLSVGSHDVAVTLVDGAGRRIGEKVARAELTVSGPSLKATALEKSPPKQPVIVTVAVEGVTVAPPAGDVSGATGSFAVFVDREPTAAGAPVPQERGIIFSSEQTISVPDLGSGEHEIWVVLVKGDNSPFDPMVADKVVVEVG